MKKVYSSEAVQIKEGRIYWNVWPLTLFWTCCYKIPKTESLNKVINYWEKWVKKENIRQAKLSLN